MSEGFVWPAGAGTRVLVGYDGSLGANAAIDVATAVLPRAHALICHFWAMPFTDRVQINVEGGHGGNGCMSFRREPKIPKGGPDGGNGGRGGGVVLVADPRVTDLSRFRHAVHHRAANGGHGDVRLAQVQEPVVALLEIIRLNRVFSTYPSVEYAVQSYQS